MQEGFNGFRYRPADSASRIDRPTLLLNGENDEWVKPDEARAIFDRLSGQKAITFFRGVGHDSYLRRRPDEWKAAVSRFLDEVLRAQ